MKHDAKRRRLLFLLVTPCLLAIGCEGQACTTMGGESGVSVDWEPSDIADSAEGARPRVLVARLCAQGVCESWTVGSNDPARYTAVTLEEDIGEVTVPVRFTVTWRDDGQRVLFDERTDVELRASHPNGEGCAPTIFGARLTADPARGLTTAAGQDRPVPPRPQ